jgi:hypothetical protein
MGTTKVTITLDDEELKGIRALVEARGAKSVSAFVQHAVAVSLRDVAGWGALLAAALEQSGGPLTKAERIWADKLLAARPAKSPTRTSRSARGEVGSRS